MTGHIFMTQCEMRYKMNFSDFGTKDITTIFQNEIQKDRFLKAIKYARNNEEIRRYVEISGIIGEDLYELAIGYNLKKLYEYLKEQVYISTDNISMLCIKYSNNEIFAKVYEERNMNMKEHEHIMKKAIKYCSNKIIQIFVDKTRKEDISLECMKKIILGNFNNINKRKEHAYEFETNTLKYNNIKSYDGTKRYKIMMAPDSEIDQETKNLTVIRLIGMCN